MCLFRDQNSSALSLLPQLQVIDEHDVSVKSFNEQDFIFNGQFIKIKKEIY